MTRARALGALERKREREERNRLKMYDKEKKDGDLRATTTFTHEFPRPVRKGWVPLRAGGARVAPRVLCIIKRAYVTAATAALASRSTSVRLAKLRLLPRRRFYSSERRGIGKRRGAPVGFKNSR
jgi:hypothetical protein